MSRSKTSSKRVLTVGDGNFSYSLAFLKKHQVALETSQETKPLPTDTGSSSALELTATSYDTYEELVDKYPESARICSQLTQLGARVLHRIDATNLRNSVTNALAVKACTSDPTDAFDLVIFNHPHCGEENVRRHQSLLSHFYNSALDLLRVVDEMDQIREGEIHLTLAEGQPERWEAIPRAVRAGLRLVRRIDDVDNDAQLGGVEYERKRHQNGKSFHRVLLHGEKLQQQSTLLIFAPATDKSSLSSIEPTETPKTTSLSRKRKAEASVVHEFVCTTCDKSFKTAQGLKTHVHMVHELGESDANKKKQVLLPCGVCDRTFKNQEAQQQHRLAKHGKHQFIQPDWFQSAQQVPETASPVSTLTDSALIADSSSVFTCAICDMKFLNQDAVQQHWQHLAPNTAVKLTCEDCDKSFDQMRALLQHQNFCTAIHNEAKTPSSPKVSDTPVA